jgi:hypothetical protein
VKRLLGPLALALVAPATAQTVVAQAAAPEGAAQAHSGSTSADRNSPAYKASFELSKMLRSEENTKAGFEGAFGSSMIETILKNPSAVSLEKDYPGITQSMIDAMRPVAERASLAQLPELWAEMASLFASRLTVEEIAVARAYYDSTSGRRLISSTIARYDYRALLQDAAKNDWQFKPETLKVSGTSNISTVVGDMTTAEQATLMEFSKTSAFGKIRDLNPKLFELAAKFANAASPDDEAELEKIARESIKAFMAAHKPKGAKK